MQAKIKKRRKILYCNLPFRGASPNEGAPLEWRNQMLSYKAKITVGKLRTPLLP